MGGWVDASIITYFPAIELGRYGARRLDLGFRTCPNFRGARRAARAGRRATLPAFALPGRRTATGHGEQANLIRTEHACERVCCGRVCLHRRLQHVAQLMTHRMASGALSRWWSHESMFATRLPLSSQSLMYLLPVQGSLLVEPESRVHVAGVEAPQAFCCGSKGLLGARGDLDASPHHVSARTSAARSLCCL